MSFGSIGYRNSASKAFYSNVKSLRSTRSISVFGNPQIITSDFKFGTQSADFDGVGDYLSVANSSETNLGTAPFCIESWVKFNSLSTPAIQYLFDYRQFSFSGVPAVFYDNANSRMVFGTGTSIRCTKVHTFNTTDWFHVALTRSGTNFRLFVNGEVSNTYTTAASMSSPVGISIGRWVGSSTTNQLNAKLDDFSITVGDAKYTANFTPPSEPISNTENTVLLLNFEKGFVDTNL